MFMTFLDFLMNIFCVNEWSDPDPNPDQNYSHELLPSAKK